MTELVTATAQIIVAMAALIGIGSGGAYVISRRLNGRSSLPGAASDVLLSELQGIHKTLKKNGEKNSVEHERLLDTLAPRKPGGG